MERRRPGPRGDITAEAVLDAAARLLDGGGLDQVSIRRIAAQVGVTPNAVYTYFPDKQAILLALVERFFGALPLQALDHPGDPVQALVSFGLAIRQRLLQAPGTVAVLMGGPMNGPAALMVGERVLGALAAAGSPPEVGARTLYAVLAYIFGSVSLDVAEVPAGSLIPDEDDWVALRANGFAQVPTEIWPLTAAVAPTMARYVTEEQFEWGLRALLRGAVG